MSVVQDYTGILYATDGDPNHTWNTVAGLHSPVIVTYSFAEGKDLTYWQDQSPYENSGYNAFTTAQRNNFRAALAQYAEVAGIIFVQVPSNQGMINVMATPWAKGVSGYANAAYSDTLGTGHGGLVVSTAWKPTDPAQAALWVEVELHELGHAMGLQHPFEGGVILDPSVDNLAHTVMTYNQNNTTSTHLGTLDIAAMQYLYGPVAATDGWDVAMVNGVLNVTGSERDDVISGVGGRSLIFGGIGGDSLFGRLADDTLHGGVGDDLLTGLGGSDLLLGEAGNDRLYSFGTMKDVDAKMDSLFGGSGDDQLFGGASTDSLAGGNGNDLLEGAAGDDTLLGGDGADKLYGGAEEAAGSLFGRDELFGGVGNDSIFAGIGADTVFGGAGSDLLRGGVGGDEVNGGAGNDSLFGDGKDVLYGGHGNDVLTQSAGADEFVTMTGGAGADSFVLVSKDAHGQFRLADFAAGEDKIDLSHFHTRYRDLAMIGDEGFSIGSVLVYADGAPFHFTAADFMF